MVVRPRAATATIVSTLLLLSAHDARTDPKTASAVVRLIYLVPGDRNVQREYVKRLEAAAEHLQIWTDDQLDGTTFSLPRQVVEIVKLPQPAEYYSTNPNGDYALWFWNNVLQDGFAATGGTFFDPHNIWGFYIDTDPGCGQAVGGTSGVFLVGANDLRGLAGEPTIQPCGGPPPDYDANVCRWVGGLGHELGHAFGLPHPPGCEDNDAATVCPADTLMFAGYITYPQTYLLDENKAALAQTPFFSPVDLKRSLGACTGKP